MYWISSACRYCDHVCRRMRKSRVKRHSHMTKGISTFLSTGSEIYFIRNVVKTHIIYTIFENVHRGYKSWDTVFFQFADKSSDAQKRGTHSLKCNGATGNACASPSMAYHNKSAGFFSVVVNKFYEARGPNPPLTVSGFFVAKNKINRACALMKTNDRVSFANRTNNLWTHNFKIKITWDSWKWKHQYGKIKVRPSTYIF